MSSAPGVDVDAVVRAVVCSVNPPPVAPMAVLARQFVFGEVWPRPGLSRRDRRLVTIPCTMVVSGDAPASAHLFGSLASGDLSQQELEEAIVLCDEPERYRLRSTLGQVAERLGSPAMRIGGALSERERRLVTLTCAGLREAAAEQLAEAIGAGQLDKRELDELVLQFAAYAGFLHATALQREVDAAWEQAGR